jgi:hypothetical protein
VGGKFCAQGVINSENFKGVQIEEKPSTWERKKLPIFSQFAKNLIRPNLFAEFMSASKGFYAICKLQIQILQKASA